MDELMAENEALKRRLEDVRALISSVSYLLSCREERPGNVTIAAEIAACARTLVEEAASQEKASPALLYGRKR